MIDGNVEEALNLRGVQVDEEGAVGAGGGEQVGDELGADGHAGAVLAILAGVAVVGHHHRDPGRRGPLERIDHHQKLHQVLVHRIAGGLHHKDIHAAHVLQQLEVDLAVGKALDLGLAHLDADVAADLLGQRPVGRAAEELEPFVLAQVAAALALGRQFGLPCLWQPPRRRQTARPLLPPPDRRPRSGSSAVTVKVSASISVHLQAGLLWLLPGVSVSRTWLGDQDSNLDKCLQRALSYH